MDKKEPAPHTKIRKPQWWQLYVMLPLIGGLFLLEMRLPLTGTEHIIAQLAILATIYACVRMWMGANRRALMGVDEQHTEWRVRVYEFAPSRLPAAAQDEREEDPLFHLPQGGVKGMLSTTFELDDYEPRTAFPASSETLFSEGLIHMEDHAGSGRNAGTTASSKSDHRSQA